VQDLFLVNHAVEMGIVLKVYALTMFVWIHQQQQQLLQPQLRFATKLRAPKNFVVPEILVVDCQQVLFSPNLRVQTCACLVIVLEKSLLSFVHNLLKDCLVVLLKIVLFRGQHVKTIFVFRRHLQRPHHHLFVRLIIQPFAR
jgi:hypothetical protein